MRDMIQGMRSLSDEEWQDYAVSEEVNDRGFLTDRVFAEHAATWRDAERSQLADKITELTSGKVTKTQGAKLTQWVAKQGGMGRGRL